MYFLFENHKAYNISFKTLITTKPNQNFFIMQVFISKVKNIQHLSFVFSNSNCTYNFPQKFILFTQQAANIHLLNFLSHSQSTFFWRKTLPINNKIKFSFSTFIWIVSIPKYDQIISNFAQFYHQLSSFSMQTLI